MTQKNKEINLLCFLIFFLLIFHLFHFNIKREKILQKLMTQQNISKKMMTKQNINDEKWNQWFAGLTDGDGCFYINKKERSVSFELTTHITDIRVVTEIKNKLKTGNVKKRSNSQSVRFRTKTKSAVVSILNRLNGKLFHPVRRAQFEAACELLGVQTFPSNESEMSNAYLAGLIDSDGSFTISVSHSSQEDSQLSGGNGKITRLINAKAHNQVLLKVTTKKIDYASLLRKVFGFGSIYSQKPNKKKKAPNPLYHWTIHSYEDFLFVYEKLRKFPLKSIKMHRLRLVPLYFKYKQLKYHLKQPGSFEAKIWAKFAKSWFKYSF